MFPSTEMNIGFYGTSILAEAEMKVAICRFFVQMRWLKKVAYSADFSCYFISTYAGYMAYCCISVLPKNLNAFTTSLPDTINAICLKYLFTAYPGSQYLQPSII